MQNPSQNPDEELELNRRRRDASINTTENSLPPIQDQKKKFLELIEDDSLKKSFLKSITDFYSNSDNLNGTFKNKIDKLLSNCFVNPDPSNLEQGSTEDAQKKFELNKVCAFLAKYDKGFIEKILPETSQLRPKVPFKGWGLDVRFEDNKIFIDDKEVKEIRNHLNTNIIEDLRKLRKDYPNNPELFPLGVMDFFRNAESAQLIYADSNIQPRPLEKIDKKTLICDDSREGFTVLQPSHDSTNVDESEFLRARIDAYCGILKGSGSRATVLTKEVIPPSGTRATASPSKVVGATGPTREPPPPQKGCSSPLSWIIPPPDVFGLAPSPAKPQSQEQKPGTAVSRRIVAEAAKYSYRFAEALFLVTTMGIRPGASGAAGLPVF